MLGSNALTSTRGATDNGDMQAMGVHLFRGESTSPRIGGPEAHQSGGSTVPPTPAIRIPACTTRGMRT